MKHGLPGQKELIIKVIPAYYVQLCNTLVCFSHCSSGFQCFYLPHTFEFVWPLYTFNQYYVDYFVGKEVIESHHTSR